MTNGSGTNGALTNGHTEDHVNVSVCMCVCLSVTLSAADQSRRSPSIRDQHSSLTFRKSMSHTIMALAEHAG